MVKVLATVASVTLAGLAPAIEPQIDAPCAIQKSTCRVPTPTVNDHPHHLASTVAPVDPVMRDVTEVGAIALTESATVTVV
jgi:hypothetical protein